MSKAKALNGQAEDSMLKTTFSQNGQTITVQLNAAGNIIFGGYSPGRSSLPSLDQVEALKHYLVHVINTYCRLPLQGIRSSGEVVSIELEKIYITLHTLSGKNPTKEEQWLENKSPFGCLDMAANVWEWTGSLWGRKWDKAEFTYPYDSNDGREDKKGVMKYCVCCAAAPGTMVAATPVVRTASGSIRSAGMSTSDFE